MDKKIELQVTGITNSQQQASAFAMVLQEIDGSRQMPVIIGSAEAQSIVLILKSVKAPRPLTHDLFTSCLKAFSIKMEEVLIYKSEEGVFYSYIFLNQGDTTLRIDSRTSDAVGLAIRYGCPIYVYESILEAEKIQVDSEKKEIEDDTDQEEIQLKSLDTLKKELKRAIQNENYELASLLRDEISRRG